jgi:hypothetical protein
MAQAGVTTTGLKETQRAVNQLPRQVTLALQSVAWRTAIRVREGAARRFRDQTKGSGATAAAIAVVDESARRQYAVVSKAPSGKPANLPLWLEFGTVKMRARAYMRPALVAEDARYRRESQDAADRAATEALR